MWVDAICINQQDKEEKSRVIPRMSDYFRRAYNVLIWLGPAADESDRLLTYFNRLRRGINGLSDQSFIEWVVSYEDEIRLRLVFFCSRDWWHRVRTFQEVELARHATVYCGNFSIDWVALNFCLESCALIDRGRIHIEFDSIVETERLTLMDDRLKAVLKRSQRSFPATHRTLGWSGFYEELNNMRARACLLQEDRIYGLLGLADRSVKDLLTVTYSLDGNGALQLYALIHRFFLCMKPREPSEDEYALIRVLSCAAGHDARPGLPTWCADWSQPAPIGNPRRSKYGSHRLSELAQRDFTPTTVSEHSVLEVRGIEIGCVAATFTDWHDWCRVVQWIKDRPDTQIPIEYDRCWLSKDDEVKRAMSDCFSDYSVDAAEQSPSNYTEVILTELDNYKCPPSHNSRRFQHATLKRALVHLYDGSFALAPRSARVQDIVVRIFGAPSAYVLRPEHDMDRNGCQYVSFGGLLEGGKLRDGTARLVQSVDNFPSDFEICNRNFGLVKLASRIYSIK